MRVLIIEDEQISAKKLVDYCNEFNSSIEVLGIIDSVKDAKVWFQNNKHPDLIFLDVHLSDKLCFSIFEDIEITSPVVFTTTYEKYAIQAFDVNSIDYLLKPIKYAEFCKALTKLERFKNNVYPSDFKNKIDTIYASISNSNNQYKERFLIKIGNKLKYVNIHEIAYFYSDNKLTYLVDNQNKTYPIDHSLDALVQLINPEKFFRINRKFIINLTSIKEIHSYFKGRLKLTLAPLFNEDIIISSDKANDFKNWLNK